MPWHFLQMQMNAVRRGAMTNRQKNKTALSSRAAGSIILLLLWPFSQPRWMFSIVLIQFQKRTRRTHTLGALLKSARRQVAGATCWVDVASRCAREGNRNGITHIASRAAWIPGGHVFMFWCDAQEHFSGDLFYIPSLTSYSRVLSPTSSPPSREAPVIWLVSRQRMMRALMSSLCACVCVSVCACVPKKAA